MNTSVLGVALALVIAAPKSSTPPSSKAPREVVQKVVDIRTALGSLEPATDAAIAAVVAGKKTLKATPFTVPCPGGGTVNGTVALSTKGSVLTKKVSLTYAKCGASQAVFSGTVAHVFVSNDAGPITHTMEGPLAYEGPTYAGNFSFNAFKVAYETAKGEAQKRCVTVTGTYSIGGTTYAVDKSIYGGSTDSCD